MTPVATQEEPPHRSPEGDTFCRTSRRDASTVEESRRGNRSGTRSTRRATKASKERSKQLPLISCKEVLGEVLDVLGHVLLVRPGYLFVPILKVPSLLPRNFLGRTPGRFEPGLAGGSTGQALKTGHTNGPNNPSH